MGFITKTSYNLMKKSLAGADIPVPSTEEPIVADEKALLTFAAWGDPQISSLSSLRSSNLTAACRDIAGMEGRLDAIVLLGDVAEFGRECEYQAAADILNSVNHKFDSFFAVAGNHDIRLRNHKKQIKRFNDFLSSVRGGVAGNDEGYFHYHDIKGNRFIMMGSDSATFEGAYISRKQLKMLDDAIGEAEKKGMNAFVFNHQTLKYTNGLPNTWLTKPDSRGSVGLQSEQLRRVFEKHGNVIFVTGHLHWGTGLHSYEDCGCFKALSLPTVGVINHGKNPLPAQGYIISVYEDKIVMRARSHAEGKWFDSSVKGSNIIIPLNKKEKKS